MMEYYYVEGIARRPACSMWAGLRALGLEGPRPRARAHSMTIRAKGRL